MPYSHTTIDFAACRPCFGFKNSFLIETVEHSLSPKTMDIELATLAYNELARRKKANRAKKFFQVSGKQPIPWLQSARSCLDILQPPDAGHYQGHLYVILVGGYSPTNQHYGAYVGSSRYLPETRFQQHKDGKHASRRVNRRGIQLLQSLTWPWRPVPGANQKRIYWESALNRCLAGVIPKVSGDYRPQEDWPSDFQIPLQKQLIEQN